MADAEFVSLVFFFLSELYILQLFFVCLFVCCCFFWLLKASFYTQIKFCINNSPIYTGFKYNGRHLNNSKRRSGMADAFSSFFSNINDVIMMSLLFLNITSVCQVLDLLKHLTIWEFLHFEENWILPINSSSWRHN